MFKTSFAYQRMKHSQPVLTHATTVQSLARPQETHVMTTAKVDSSSMMRLVLNHAFGWLIVPSGKVSYVSNRMRPLLCAQRRVANALTTARILLRISISKAQHVTVFGSRFAPSNRINGAKTSILRIAHAEKLVGVVLRMETTSKGTSCKVQRMISPASRRYGVNSRRGANFLMTPSSSHRGLIFSMSLTRLPG